MIKNVYLIRHAESEANVSGVDLGDAPALSDRGRAQAQIIARRIAGIPGINRIICSTLPRSLETAGVVAEQIKLPIERNPLFDQRKRPSQLIGKSHLSPEAMLVMREIFEGYTLPGHRHSDEENLDDLRHRTTRALDFLETHQDDTLCVFTHGMFLRALFANVFSGGSFTGTDLQHAIEHLEPESTGITHFRWEPFANPISGKKTQLWRIISWNDSTHLS